MPALCIDSRQAAILVASGYSHTAECDVVDRKIVRYEEQNMDGEKVV
jgi:hypothetical protein